jgi:uncharacterized protein YbbC (DUF1343 family)
MRAHHLSLLGLVACAAPAAVPPPVRPGIEVLLSDSLHLVAGKRIALLTNQTGVDRAGHRDVDLLRATPGVQLAFLYSPEHGFRGAEDRPDLPDAVDSASGLPIYNLYGAPRASALARLGGLDAVLVDLQDIGARYYTYVSTSVVLMQAAARLGKPVIVLDRPNPLGGEVVQGNVRARPAPVDSFVGVLPVPMRHGMTLGELLLFANDLLGIHARVTVVPVARWRRTMYFDETGLRWVPPSPAMRDLESAMHYPGTCLFEGTNLSVGRGTPSPFTVIGAPWLDPAAVIRRVGEEATGQGEGLGGVGLTSDTLTPSEPSDGKYGRVKINVVRLQVTDRRAYDPTHTAVVLLVTLHALYPDSLRFVAARFDQLAAGAGLRAAVLAGRPAADVWAGWDATLREFQRIRGRYLIY